jgi:asparagine N-glycosylation enzyme membrane subunit Stt3
MRRSIRFPQAGWAVVLLVCAWAAVHVVAANTVSDSVFDGGLLGTDSYMRLVRVDELVDGGGWYDSTIERSNAPYGDELHWTRPFDVLLLSVAGPLTPFVGFDNALFVAGAAISPLLQLAMMVVLVWAVAPLVGRARAPMAAIVLLVQPAVLGHTVAGQADHHSLQLLLLALTLGLLLRALQEPERHRSAAWAGVAAGLGIWVSTEATLLAGIVGVALAGAWIVAPEGRARAFGWFGGGLAATMAVAIAVERVPADWFAVEYDKVSLPHLAAGLAVLAVAAGFTLGERRVEGVLGRLGVAAGVGAVGGGALLAVFPGLLEGPQAAVNPAIEPIWLDHVRELQPLWPSDGESLGTFLLYLGAGLVCLPLAAVRAWRCWQRGEAFLGWAAVAVLLGVYFTLSLMALRFASFAGVLVAVVSAEAIGLVRDWLGRVPGSIWRKAAWIGATLTLSVGFTVGGGVVAAANVDPATVNASSVLGCSREAYAALDAASEPGDVVFAHINLGPEILYRTHASVVAGPYHRNDDGILDLHAFFASADEGVSRGIAEERGGRFVLFCELGTTTDLYAAEPPAMSLHDLLRDDRAPSWLTLVARGDGETPFRLYEIAGSR